MLLALKDVYQKVEQNVYMLDGSIFGKRDLLAIFHVMKYDVKYSFKCCKPF